MKLILTALFSIYIIFNTIGCAVLHRTQLAEVDSKAVLKGQRFEVLLSETGVNLQEATDIAKSLTQHQKTSDDMQAINDIIAMFQMGPRTGNMVFNEKYADAVPELILKNCPSGRVSSLMSIRETNKYPVVSGEIVRLVGYCIN
jgi:hypothetical protein